MIGLNFGWVERERERGSGDIPAQTVYSRLSNSIMGVCRCALQFCRSILFDMRYFNVGQKSEHSTETTKQNKSSHKNGMAFRKDYSARACIHKIKLFHAQMFL